MAFVTDKIYKVGDKAVLTKDHSNFMGTMKAGTEVTIIGEGYRGYDIEDAEGNKITECGYVL